MRKPAAALPVAVALAALLGPARAAHALPPGTLVVTASALDPASAGSDKTLRKASRKALKRADGKWHVYFVAFLKKAPRAPDLNLVFYDPKNKKEAVNAYPF